MALEKFIPISEEKPAMPDAGDVNEASACQAKEPFALMVLGDSMEPEFSEGDIIIIDPEGVARDGSYVLAWHNEEHIFRQLVVDGDKWLIKALNDDYPVQQLSGPDAVQGVITQKTKPGRRKETVQY